MSPPLAGAELSVLAHPTVPWLLQGGQGQTGHKGTHMVLGLALPAPTCWALLAPAPLPQQSTADPILCSGFFLLTSPILRGCCSSVPTSREHVSASLPGWGQTPCGVTMQAAMANPCKRQAGRSLCIQVINRLMSSLSSPLCFKECTQCSA